MTTKEVKAILKEHNLTWKEFGEFIGGQTVGMDKNGDINYYECDVERFVKGGDSFRF